MEELMHVLWIGGPAGAGKTTVARQLARRHGLRWYNSDAHTWEHRDRAIALGVELPDRGPGSHLYDRKVMIIEDLHALPRSPLIIAEGGPITPAMARPPHRAVWLMPSKHVQRVRLEERHPTGVPAAYLNTWAAVSEQVKGTDVTTISVDSLTVEETIAHVERAFAAVIAEGPAASTVDGRRELLRYANQAIVTQCTSPSARPLNPPNDPGAVVRLFECECAMPGCVELVELPVTDAASAVTTAPPTILASGHETELV